MDAIADRYFPVIDALSEEVERLEETIFAGQTTRANIAALYDLKCKLARLERTRDTVANHYPMIPSRSRNQNWTGGHASNVNCRTRVSASKRGTRFERARTPFQR